MQQVITVELLNESALKLLQQLEQLNILRVVSEKAPPKPKQKQWAGSISKETASDMLQKLQESRNEWERT
ncbi:MAG: hypothetical protein EPO28_14545 [Saprospiraceae bacterium]|nr:MAG: hypothetical protein EPO28_14545 [Saprospiraceae bacterium]